ncbi:MAG: Flp pilus assembly protein CpaB [Elusimicrobia bacterium RIFOXYB2_FULL_49_7]|nr:MAG: Flp pilus assembly protein CpaB [Elusimicrobia bacterium RIFOXYB2_FULL_49_7]
MFKKKSVLMVISLASGLFGAILLYLHNIERDKILQDRLFLVAAAKSVAAQQVLGDKHLQIIEVPVAFAPKGAVAKKEQAVLLGRKCLLPLEAGQIILWNYIDIGNAGYSLASRIKVGMRAMTLSVDKVTGMETMLQPGHRLDVLATFNQPGEKRRLVTRTLLQNLIVLAVGNDRYAGDYATLTLQVTPDQAELLAFAEKATELRFVLRSENDVESRSETSLIDFDNFLHAKKNAINETKNVRAKVVYE